MRQATARGKGWTICKHEAEVGPSLVTVGLGL